MARKLTKVVLDINTLEKLTGTSINQYVNKHTKMVNEFIKEKPIKKNTAKYLSFKYAYERIDLAISKKFYLEAAMIQESIISDRLQSFLSGKKVIKIKKDQYLSLGYLINKTKDILNDDLVLKLMKWKNDRNFIAHQIVKSDPGEPTIPIEEYLAKAKETAETGLLLCRSLTKSIGSIANNKKIEK